MTNYLITKQQKEFRENVVNKCTEYCWTKSGNVLAPFLEGKIHKAPYFMHKIKNLGYLICGRTERSCLQEIIVNFANTSAKKKLMLRSRTTGADLLHTSKCPN